MTALGAALYHDFSLSESPAPFAALVDTVFPVQDDLEQFCVPLAPRKEAPTPFKRGTLLQRIVDGKLASAMVKTRVSVADDETVTLGIVLAPTTAAAQEGRAGYRYRLDLAVGGATLARRGTGAIVDAVVAFAAAVGPRAGVVFPAETASYAHALATGTRGGLSESQDQRVKDVFYAVYELGDRIRGPEWGTFLGAHHLAKLGDTIEQRAKASGCDIVRRFSHGVYLQVTEALDDPTRDARIATLADALADVR